MYTLPFAGSPIESICLVLIKQDALAAGTTYIGVNPMRLMPNDSDVFSMLMQQWDTQDGICALCDRQIPLKPENKLLQMSRDRTDSANKAYDWRNTRLTHLAWNLGKRRRSCGPMAGLSDPDPESRKLLVRADKVIE